MCYIFQIFRIHTIVLYEEQEKNEAFIHWNLLIQGLYCDMISQS